MCVHARRLLSNLVCNSCGPPPTSPTKVVPDTANIEKGVHIIEPRPSLGLLISHRVGHLILLPPQPSDGVVPAQAHDLFSETTYVYIHMYETYFVTNHRISACGFGSIGYRLDLLQWIVEMHKNACSVWANGSTHAIGNQAGMNLKLSIKQLPLHAPPGSCTWMSSCGHISIGAPESVHFLEPNVWELCDESSRRMLFYTGREREIWKLVKLADHCRKM